MYFLFEYVALLTLAVMAATVAFGIASIILVIREAVKWLAVASPRLFLGEAGVFFGRRRSPSKAEFFGQVASHAAPRWHRSSVESITRIARPAV